MLTNTDSGEQLGKVASGITMLFGAMAIWVGLFAAAIGICMQCKCPKLASCCACFVSTHFIDGLLCVIVRYKKWTETKTEVSQRYLSWLTLVSCDQQSLNIRLSIAVFIG